MVRHFTVVLVCQLLGEILVHVLSVPVPGPVLGMFIFLVLLISRPGYAAAVSSTVKGLLDHLSLLFVPAGVGIIGHIQTLDDSIGIVLLSIVVSTIAALVASVYAFTLTAKFYGQADD